MSHVNANRIPATENSSDHFVHVVFHADRFKRVLKTALGVNCADEGARRCEAQDAVVNIAPSERVHVNALECRQPVLNCNERLARKQWTRADANASQPWALLRERQGNQESARVLG
jgi:hypothetical protein